MDASTTGPARYYGNRTYRTVWDMSFGRWVLKPFRSEAPPEPLFQMMERADRWNS